MIVASAVATAAGLAGNSKWRAPSNVMRPTVESSALSQQAGATFWNSSTRANKQLPTR